MGPIIGSFLRFFKLDIINYESNDARYVSFCHSSLNFFSFENYDFLILKGSRIIVNGERTSWLRPFDSLATFFY